MFGLLLVWRIPTDSRLRRPAPAIRRAHRNRRTTRRSSPAPASRRRRFPAQPADRGMEAWSRWLRSEKNTTCCQCRLPALQQISRPRATWPTPDAAASSAIPPQGAPFLRAGAPRGGYRNTARARALAIRPASPWFSASRADGRHRRYRMRCVVRPPASKRPCQRPDPATVREFDGNSYCFPLLPRNELFQLLAQRFVRAEQQRLGGGFAQLQHAGNLAVIHLLILVHDYGHALALGQCVYLAADGRQPLPLQYLLFGAERLVGQVGRIASFLVRLIEAHSISRTFVPRIARVVNRQVGRDAIKPGRKLGARLVTGARPVHAQKHFLRQFLRGRWVAAQAVHEAHHRPAIFLHQVS